MSGEPLPGPAAKAVFGPAPAPDGPAQATPSLGLLQADARLVPREAAPPLDPHAPMRLAQASPPASSPGATSTDAAQGAETLAPGAAQPGEFVSLIDLLDELRAPPPPPPVAMTPQTAGWLVVGAVLALLLGWVLLAARRRRRANAWRREALAALAQAGDDPAAVAPILRRAALALRPRAEVAGLTGAGWLAFLDATGGPGFAEGPGRALASGPYDGRGAPAPGLGALAARWVRRARAEGGR